MPATEAADTCLERVSSRARRNKPSSLPQASELSVGDHTGIPAGSPSQVSAAVWVRTTKTPSCTPAAAHPVIADAAMPRTRSSHILGEARELDLFIIGADPSHQLPVRPAGELSFVCSIRIALLHGTCICAYHREMR